jgi:hypothetical protein
MFHQLQVLNKFEDYFDSGLDEKDYEKKEHAPNPPVDWVGR